MPTLFPFEPVSGIQENIGYLTNVLSAFSEEQRIALRQEPRLNLRFDFDFTPGELSAAQQLVRENPLGEWYCPLWQYVQTVGDLASGATTINVDTSKAPWVVGQKIIVQSEYNVAEEIEVSAIASGSLTFASPGLTQAYTNAIIAPVITAISVNGISVTRSDSFFISAAMTFLSWNYPFSRNSTYPQYKSIDVITERSVMTEDIPIVVSQNAALVENGLGAPEPVETESFVRVQSALNFTDYESDRLVRRQWIDSLYGRQRPFWLPTWNDDFNLTADISGTDTVLQVSETNSTAVGRSVLIETTSGAFFYRDVSAVSDTSMTISASLGQSFTVAEIVVICFIDQVRLSADSITLNHPSNVRTDVTLPVTSA